MKECRRCGVESYYHQTFCMDCLCRDDDYRDALEQAVEAAAALLPDWSNAGLPNYQRWKRALVVIREWYAESDGDE